MDTNTNDQQPFSIEELIHKEKKQKKTTVNSSTVNSPLDNSTIVKGIIAVKPICQQIEAEHSSLLNVQQLLENRTRNHQLMLNAEIDLFLHELLLSGLTSPTFVPWVARCCHTLGLVRVNHLSVSARSGRSPDRLFASLLKGAMQLHAKSEFYASSGQDEPS